MNVQLDDIDIAILKILQEDSTISTKDVAAQIGLSATPTYERIKYLEQEGIIKKYVALVDREKIGLDLVAYCNIVVKEQSKKALNQFEKSIAKFPEVIEVVSLSGTYDFMLKIVAKDIRSYNDFLIEKLANLTNISQYHSNIVMHESKKETAYPLYPKET